MARRTRPETGFEVPEDLGAAASAIQAPAAQPAPAAPSLKNEAGPQGGGRFDPAADHKPPPITADMFATTERYRISMTLERLRKLGQTNPDVRWLLAQYHGLKTALEE